MRFMTVVKSYLEVFSETSDYLNYLGLYLLKSEVLGAKNTRKPFLKF